MTAAASVSDSTAGSRTEQGMIERNGEQPHVG
jgi:hypothetical protein